MCFIVAKNKITLILLVKIWIAVSWQHIILSYTKQYMTNNMISEGNITAWKIIYYLYTWMVQAVTKPLPRNFHPMCYATLT